MNSTPDCFECGLKQCERIARLCRKEEKIPALRQRLEEMRGQLDLREPPGTFTSKMLMATMEFLGEQDPFRLIRAEQNQKGLELAERYDAELGDGKESLLAAIVGAAAGNVMDVGPRHRFDFAATLARGRLAHDDTNLLVRRLQEARRLVYILDNAGEALFDRLVLKRLGVPEVTIVARSTPILNDVTVDEARALGFEQLGRVIGTGSPYLGFDLNTISAAARQVYYDADVVIAKGHANFESLVDDGRDGFYLLTAKCELVARRLGVNLGNSVLFYSKGKG